MSRSNHRPRRGVLTCPSIRRVNTARALLEAEPFCGDRWRFCGPWLRTILTRRTCGFSWAWPPAGGHRKPDVGDEQRLALLDEAIAAFRSILIRQPGLVRVRLELALAFYLKEEDQLARGPFRPGPGGPAACGPGRQHQPVFERHAGSTPLARVFRVLHCPGYQYQRRVGRAVHLYPMACRSAGGRRAWPVRLSGSWVGVGANTSFPWPTNWRLRTGHRPQSPREYKGSQFDQTYAGCLRGAALVDQPEYRNEPAGFREPTLVRWFQLQL